MGVQDEKLRTGNRKTVFSVSTNDNSPVTFFFLFLSWEGMSVFLLNCPLSSGRDSAISPLTMKPSHHCLEEFRIKLSCSHSQFLYFCSVLCCQTNSKNNFL